MKKCIGCLKEKSRVRGTRLCTDCHKVWKGLHHSSRIGEGAKHRMMKKIGQTAFFRLASFEGSQVAAANSSGNMTGVA